jgi:hypothetical protein
MTMPWHRRKVVRGTLLLLALGALVAWIAALTAPPALAANVVNVTFHNPADVRINPCFPDDTVNLNGDIHVVITTTANGRDGYQVKNHLNAHLKGVSITTGTKYVSNEINNEQWPAGSPFPGVHRDTYTFVLVSQGSTPNYVLHITVRETVDEAGTTDATAEQWSMSCQGSDG